MTMTLGELRDALAACPRDAVVVYRDFDMHWDGLDSWRGSYDEPAIGYSTVHEESTVEEVLAEIDAALNGKVFHGYKGGQYKFNRNSPVHVDNYGEYHPRVHLERVEMLADRWACLVLSIHICV